MSSVFRLNMEDLLRQRDGRISVWNLLVHPQQPGVHGPHEARCDLTDTKGRIPGSLRQPVEKPTAACRTPGPQEMQRESKQIHQPFSKHGIHRIDDPRPAPEPESEDANHRKMAGMACRST